MMPVSVRLNHAIADGFLVANVYRLLEKEMAALCIVIPCARSDRVHGKTAY
jgi:chloramphenicol O-acetyltransferase